MAEISDDSSKVKELELNEKMEMMRKKNEEIKKRHQEIEEDKKNAESSSETALSNSLPVESKIRPVTSRLSNKTCKARLEQNVKPLVNPGKHFSFSEGDGPPPDPKYSFLADDERDFPRHDEVKKDVLVEKKINRPKVYRGGKQNNGGCTWRTPDHKFHEKSDSQWRAERAMIDAERIERQKTQHGTWRREWDNNKNSNDNVGYRTSHEPRSFKKTQNDFDRNTWKKTRDTFTDTRNSALSWRNEEPSSSSNRRTNVNEFHSSKFDYRDRVQPSSTTTSKRLSGDEANEKLSGVASKSNIIRPIKILSRNESLKNVIKQAAADEDEWEDVSEEGQ